jgi:hypothetical protein
MMELSASANSAEVATSATKAGSYAVVGKAECSMRLFHPPAQEATAVKLWRNAQRVSSEALAKEDTLRRVPPKTQKGPRL